MAKRCRYPVAENQGNQQGLDCARGIAKKRYKNKSKRLVLRLFVSIMAGSQDLAGPGVGQVPKKVSQRFGFCGA